MVNPPRAAAYPLPPCPSPLSPLPSLLPSPPPFAKHPAGPPASHPIWNRPSLDHLINNNKKWVSSVKAEDPDYFKRLASIHTPEHLFIGCSDARLSVQSMLVSGKSRYF